MRRGKRRRNAYHGRRLTRASLEPRPIRERFLALVVRQGGHWLWKGRCNRDGAGVFRTLRGTALARRVSFVLFAAEVIPARARVVYICTAKGCLRPEHLRCESAQERRVKLNLEAARCLRAERAEGVSIAELAARYGLSVHHAARVARGECWRKVA